MLAGRGNMHGKAVEFKKYASFGARFFFLFSFVLCLFKGLLYIMWTNVDY